MKSKNLLNYFLLVIIFSTLFITIITIPITNSSIENQTLESSQPSKTKQDQNPSASAWITNGLPVCIEGNEAMLRSICSDGAEGAITAWEDNRTGNLNKAIYVQRISSDGEVLWDTNGVALCIITDSGEPKPVICSDGAGGAIVAWEDYRNGNNDIYAQRVNSSGDAVWSFNGIPICINNSYQYGPRIISDGVKGAIIIWTDQRMGNSDVYAQRVDSDGNIHTGWSIDGEVVCDAPAAQYFHAICSDGNEGAIVAWLDVRPPYDGLDIAVFAQRIGSNGITQWAPVDGKPICTITKFMDVHMKICSDGVNGAIIAWSDNRSDNEDVYAQRIDINGNTLWSVNGIPVCTYNSIQRFDDFAEFICSDGNEGAIITWKDNRTDSSYDIYAQKINSTGDTQWDANGIVISNETNSQENAHITYDGRGGAYIVWEDERKGNEDIYAQHISFYGNVKLTANGTIICNATDRQRSPQIVSDGAGGLIIAWTDDRNGYWNTDIYASKIYGIFSSPPPSGGGDGDDSTKYELFDPTMIVVIGLIVVASAISLVTGRTYVARKGGIRKDTGKIKDYIKQREEVVEDDIVLSKEKHFCLVHKGPIEGYNFICPTCNAYYCIRCVEALKELENACWSCGKPLDPSQPIKSLDEEYDITPITEKESKLDATKGKSDNKKLKPKS